MMTRSDVAQVIADLVGFAKVAAVRLGASSSAEVKAEATTGDGRAWSEVWGHSPLVYRPAAGGECLYIELGDERVVFATKDRRWQVETREGEVVVRALGSKAAYVRLTPEGGCVVNADSIQLGGGATGLVALAELVESAIASAITSHTHTTPSGGGASGPGTLAGTVTSTAATKVKAE